MASGFVSVAKKRCTLQMPTFVVFLQPFPLASDDDSKPQLVCRRAKFHFDDQVNYSDDVSVHSDESSHMDFYEKHFREINERMKDVMYFL